MVKPGTLTFPAEMQELLHFRAGAHFLGQALLFALHPRRAPVQHHGHHAGEQQRSCAPRDQCSVLHVGDVRQPSRPHSANGGQENDDRPDIQRDRRMHPDRFRPPGSAPRQVDIDHNKDDLQQHTQ